MKNKSIIYITLGLACIISSLFLSGTFYSSLQSIKIFLVRFLKSIHYFIESLTNSILHHGNNAVGLLILIVVISILVIISKEK